LLPQPGLLDGRPPRSRRGLVTAGTLAWARSLGEFGPILAFSGAARMKTILPTTVFLELSVRNSRSRRRRLPSMIAAAVLVLVVIRRFGTGLA
jgi:molybdate transport system permease protein